jgi:pyruvate dehydrogenase E1 component beta subunit
MELTSGFSQYATNLEALAFPDTPIIVKVAKRALYRTD